MTHGRMPDNKRAGCYLCRPDDPSAEDEACADCDRAFWENPVAIYIEGGY